MTHTAYRVGILLVPFAVVFLLASCATGSHNSLPAGSTTGTQAFVGYWYWRDAEFLDCSYLAIDKTARGYTASWSGKPSFAVPLRNGYLLLQQATRGEAGAPGVRPQWEIAWKKGTDVSIETWVDQSGAWSAPTPYVLHRVTKTGWAAGLTSYRDELTRYNSETLAGAVMAWSLHQAGPPHSDQMHPGSAFARWMAKHSLGAWPTNPFTRKTMRMGKGLGDFTYRVRGKAWQLIGHLSDGRSQVEDENHI